MKKLEKLMINPEKVIRNEELVNFKGGYNEYQCWCGTPPMYTFWAKANDCWGAIQWAIEECGDSSSGCPCVP